MGRLVGRLRALQVQRAKRGKLHDGGGLYLSCHRDGSKSWVFRYGAQGKRHCGLGPLHTITLKEARERARKCRQLLLDGCVGTILCRAATVRCSAYPGPSAWLGIRLARSTSIWFCARSRVGRRIRSWRALSSGAIDASRTATTPLCSTRSTTPSDPGPACLCGPPQSSLSAWSCFYPSGSDPR